MVAVFRRLAGLDGNGILKKPCLLYLRRVQSIRTAISPLVLCLKIKWAFDAVRKRARERTVYWRPMPIDLHQGSSHSRKRDFYEKVTLQTPGMSHLRSAWSCAPTRCLGAPTERISTCDLLQRPIEPRSYLRRLVIASKIRLAYSRISRTAKSVDAFVRIQEAAPTRNRMPGREVMCLILC